MRLEGVTLYTTYTSISVPPGESLNYNVELKNDTGSVVTVPLSIEGLPSKLDGQNDRRRLGSERNFGHAEFVAIDQPCRYGSDANR
ncbi:hypothetical protein VQ056_14425 [Paenibacillus sp. JTLBN-2024]